MNKALFLAAGLAFVCGSTPAFADDEMKPSSDEMKKIEAALEALGCKGGEFEKEKSGLFEVDDAQCKEGQMDVKLSKDYKVLVISAD